ncbi:MAG: type II secretion system protein [Candidatus Brocadiae bacterium]|nr:type II secretion system protein [Candidatus Brocadiia bacterium]
MRRTSSGFTLMELLVAVGLMVILMTAVVLIFYRSTDVMKINTARITIYENARQAVDTLAGDLQNSVPFDGGQQRMWFQNFVRPAGTAPVGDNVDGARDYVGMVTVATAPALGTRELRTVYSEYYLRNDDDAETNFTGAGYTSAQRSQRQIFVLVRRMWAIPASVGGSDPLKTAQMAGVPLSVPSYAATTAPPVLAPPFTFMSMPLIEEGDLCHWVMSFNIEACYDASPTDPTNPATYMELDGAGNPYLSSVMPLGDALATDPRIPRKFRITIRVIEGAGERQERTFQREVWCPLGG